MSRAAEAVSPSVLFGRDAAVRAPARRDLLAPVLLPLGVAFLVVAGADIGLTWYPLRFGSPEWELGTIMQTLNGMPVFSLGLALLWSWALGRRSRWPLLAVSAAMIFAAVAVVTMTALLALAVTVALHALQASPIRLGLEKATLKAGMQAVAFTTVFLWLGATGLRKARNSRAWLEGV